MRSRAGVDRLIVTAIVVTTVVGAAFATVLVRGRPVAVLYDLFLFHNGPPAVILVWLGLVVLRRQPGNGAGRVLLAIAVLSAAHATVAALADVRLVAAGHVAPMTDFADGLRPADLPFDTAFLVFVMNWLWVPAPVLMITILPLVFPDGGLPGRRWWPVPVAAAVSGAMLIVALGIDAWPTATWTAEGNPAAVNALLAGGGLGVLVTAVGSFAALGIRWHRAEATRRRPFHIVGLTAGILGLVVVAAYPWQQVWIPAVLLAWYAMLGAYALAVARYGLHDMEPFLGRAAVAGILSVLLAAAYAAIAICLGIIAGRPFDGPLLPIALGALALLIEPARRRAGRLAGRWLFRSDADRTEVLSRVAAHASTSPTAADILHEVTGLLVRSTGADRAEAWLDADGSGPAAAAGDPVPSAPALTVEVTHQGERFGELRLFARVHADLVGDARELLADVAHALGVVLRNEQLTTRLQSRLDELRASRQRLVEAHDRGRRSLERDIHDGAQSRLIALRLRIGATRERHGHDNPGLAGDLDDLAREVDTAVRSLRDLARGLAPPLLEQFGLAAALRAHTRTLPTAVEITVEGDVRHAPEIESAAYFCCLEAIQNATRHSGATTITVGLAGDADVLRLEVEDDGVGFDPDITKPAITGRGTGLANIGDRIAALGGHTRIDSAPGAGTRVVVTIPARVAQEGPVAAER